MTSPLVPRIILTTLNARYSHASFGLRYLMANLGQWQSHTSLLEFTIAQSPLEIVEQLLSHQPTVIGFGVYIWNVTQITEIMAILKALRPDIRLVIGGPEVSYEYEGREIFRLCDHLITGEADVAFRELIDGLAFNLPMPKVTEPPLPDLQKLVLPYAHYSDQDLAQRLLYVEASRGCPFRCEFCLSSLDIPVRAFPLEDFLASLKDLLARGARAFKFVDRTFNLNLKTSSAILQFCLEHYKPGFELHFEMIPDRLPAELRSLVSQFPPGAVQFEIGIQTFTPEVSRLISRPQHVDRITENFRFLRGHTGVHIHADLIFGLPAETEQTFAESFNRLLDLDPDEIQLGFLKRLKGTPITRHTGPYGLVFSPRPPYEVLQTSTVSFDAMQRMKRFARYLDLYHNSGNFKRSLQPVFSSGETPYHGFAQLADWLYLRTGQTHQFALTRLYQLLFEYGTQVLGLDASLLGEWLLEDYDRHQLRRERLEFLRPYVTSVAAPEQVSGSTHGQRRKGKAQEPHPSAPLAV